MWGTLMKVNSNIAVRLPRCRTELLEKSLAIAALALVVFGIKVLLIKHFGSSVPYWDQWDAEADLLYKSYLNSDLSFTTLISSHNEHRILITRIVSLALFELDGGWDPILQMIANAGLHVVAIVLLVTVFQQVLRSVHFLPLILFSMLVFVLPIGWENLLAGFQSQFYFLMIFSLLALSGFATSEALSFKWWMSILVAVASYFSMASGALTAAAALCILILQMLFGVRKGPGEYIAAALLLAISVVMITYIRDVEAHDSYYKAHSMGQFLKALLECVTYPRSDAFSGVWVNVPLVVYACWVLVTRPARESPHWIILSIIVWLFAQSLSLSYGRSPAVRSARYLDLLIVGLPLNFGVLLFAQSNIGARGKQVVVSLVAIAWLFIVLPALIGNTIESSIPAIVQKAAESREQSKNVAAYFETQDITVLQGKASQAIPYPSPERLASLLSDPAIRLILPEQIRPADVDQKQALDRTFLKGKFRSIIEGLKSIVENRAPWVVGWGIVLAFAAGLLRQRLRTSASSASGHARWIGPQESSR